nr:3'(2'),5'-bisphosphate nucleotidase CysQ [Acuticoccus kalidii]
MTSAREDTDVLVAAVRAGGEVARRYFGAAAERWDKADGTPVSVADLEVDRCLAEHLRGARPHYGWVSEETSAAPGVCGRAFVVDPIDGTRAFLRGETAWTVVAAVVEDGRPIAAAILRPVTGVLYCASLGGGAFRDGAPVHVTGRTRLDGAEIAAPGPLFREGGFPERGVKRAASIPSLALRLARVAEGRLDGVITKQGPHHWDLAAADLIVHEAGGTLTSLDGTRPLYDSASTAHAPIVAGPRDLAEALRRLAADYAAHTA